MTTSELRNKVNNFNISFADLKGVETAVILDLYTSVTNDAVAKVIGKQNLNVLYTELKYFRCIETVSQYIIF